MAAKTGDSVSRRKRRKISSSPSSAAIDSDSYHESSTPSSGSADDDESEFASDAIDEPDEGSDVDDETETVTPTKRKTPASTPQSKKSATAKASSSTKIADLVPAPKKTAPPGQLSKTTLAFLADLARENEREWLQRHDAPYRHAMNEWKAFVDALSIEMSQADWTLPVLPAKDLVHRLARDIRFSNDKTPYKTSFQSSFSRTGRKGPYAGYFMLLQPGNRSFIAGGKWGPEKNELATIRINILRRPQRLRRVIGAENFVRLFGEPKPAGPGKRQNVFGRDDELKNAPKLDGVDKTHKDIDLLKCKSFVVSKTFTDKEILSEDIISTIGKVVGVRAEGFLTDEQADDCRQVMAPLVQLLNEMIMPTPDGEESDTSEEEDTDEGRQRPRADGETDS